MGELDTQSRDPGRVGMSVVAGEELIVEFAQLGIPQTQPKEEGSDRVLEHTRTPDGGDATINDPIQTQVRDADMAYAWHAPVVEGVGGCSK